MWSFLSYSSSFIHPKHSTIEIPNFILSILIAQTVIVASRTFKIADRFLMFSSSLSLVYHHLLYIIWIMLLNLSWSLFWTYTIVIAIRIWVFRPANIRVKSALFLYAARWRIVLLIFTSDCIFASLVQILESCFNALTCIIVLFLFVFISLHWLIL